VQDLFGPLIFTGDALTVLRTLSSGVAQTCVTSPPYFGLRDYGHACQIGLEFSPDAYVARLVEIFREVRRVLRDDGTLWLNLGDSYARSPLKGGSGPGSKSTDRGAYGAAQSAKRPGTDRGRRASRIDATQPVGLSNKQLIGIPWRVAFALQADGWCLRQDIIWSKPNTMPESVTDRCTKAHEYIFLLSKRPNYYFDAEAIKEPAVNTRLPGRKIKETRHYGAGNGGNAGLTGLMGKYHSDGLPTHRNKRSVWHVPTIAYKGAHFATFPVDLITPCILAGSPRGGMVLDPFAGSGTTGVAAQRHGRGAVLIELNADYVELMRGRLNAV
jgi:DNA modification methylase